MGRGEALEGVRGSARGLGVAGAASRGEGRGPRGNATGRGVAGRCLGGARRLAARRASLVQGGFRCIFVTLAEARTLERCLLPVDLLLYLPFTRNLQQLHSYFRSTTVRYFLLPILLVAPGKELQPITASRLHPDSCGCPYHHAEE